MDNLEWLNKMKDESKGYMELDGDEHHRIGWSQPDYRIQFRQIRALEIIAEELIKCNTYLAYIKLKVTKRG